MFEVIRVRRVAALFLATVLGASAWAQGNVTEELPHSRGSQGEGPQADGAVSPKGQATQVGAGTTNGTTTGYSGPKSEPAAGSGRLPDLPSAKLCEPYRQTDAHRSCMQTVLRKTEQGGSP